MEGQSESLHHGALSLLINLHLLYLLLEGGGTAEPTESILTQVCCNWGSNPQPSWCEATMKDG